MLKVRRTDRVLDETKAYDIIDKADFATMSFVGDAYLVPISTVREDKTLYFHCAKSGRKTDLMRQNSQVCLSFVTRFTPSTTDFTLYYESAYVVGTASEVEDIECKRHALSLLSQRFTPKVMHKFDSEFDRSQFRTAVWRVDIIEVSAKAKNKPSVVDIH